MLFLCICCTGGNVNVKIIAFDDFRERTRTENGTIRMAMGVFDGIHAGHQKLLEHLDSSHRDIPRYVFTFTNNPKVVLGRKGYDKNIITLEQKLNLLSAYHVDAVVLIDFSYEFSKLRGEEFFTMITNACDLQYVVIGENFSCGYKAAFTAARIRQWFSEGSTEVDIVDSVLLDGVRVSSSLIRKQILHHQLEEAARMLGREFSIDVAGIPLTEEDGKFRIGKEDIRQMLPPPGLYDAQFRFSGYSEQRGTLYIHRNLLECYCEKRPDAPLAEIAISSRHKAMQGE
jgi:riboflavin kinase/FMN adenylyltransferase